MSSFGDNVRWLRTKRSLSQKELAALVSLRGRRHPCSSYISCLESGRRDPRLSIIRSMAKALGVKPWQLLADLSENSEFWEHYLSLSPKGKREIQRLIERQPERRP